MPPADLRARFPFGTEAGPITAEVTGLLAERAAAPSAVAATPAATPAELAARQRPGRRPARARRVEQHLGRPETPVIVTLTEPDGTPLDGSQAVAARVIGANETATAPDVTAVAIQPAGAKRASFVATVQVPVAGWWRLDLVTADGRKGSVADRGAGSGCVRGDRCAGTRRSTPRRSTTSAARRSRSRPRRPPTCGSTEESTADARAAGRPYVLVVDSARFKVSPACGRAITMVGYLVDRWADEVAFVHLEPFTYQVVTEAPILAGDLADPPLND